MHLSELAAIAGFSGVFLVFLFTLLKTFTLGALRGKHRLELKMDGEVYSINVSAIEHESHAKINKATRAIRARKSAM